MNLHQKYLLNYAKHASRNLFIFNISYIKVTGLPTCAYLYNQLEYSNFALVKKKTNINNQSNN